MSPSANVFEIDALDKLKGSLIQFSGTVQEALDSARPEIRRTFEWLQERQSRWQKEVLKRQVAVEIARIKLARCQESGYRDQQGNYHSPNCSDREEDLLRAQVRLREAEAELSNAQHWMRLIQEAVTAFEAQSQRLNTWLASELPLASALLSQKVATLQAYVSDGGTLNSLPEFSTVSVGTSLADSRAQGSFRSEMEALTSNERGAWCERAVQHEARSHGHRILSAHPDEPSTPGYDCVSWDGNNLHIWEAKNRSATEIGESEIEYKFGAIDSERRLANVKRFLLELPSDDPERSRIVEAIQHDNVQWHIRLGPDTNVSFSPLDKLGWGNVEVRQYSYDEMLPFLIPSAPSTLNPLSPAEFREGNIGGSERRG